MMAIGLFLEKVDVSTISKLGNLFLSIDMGVFTAVALWLGQKYTRVLTGTREAGLR